MPHTPICFKTEKVSFFIIFVLALTIIRDKRLDIIQYPNRTRKQILSNKNTLFGKFLNAMQYVYWANQVIE